MTSLHLSFDRGTLRLRGDPRGLAALPNAAWDERASVHRAPAMCRGEIAEAAMRASIALTDAVADRCDRPIPGWSRPSLRPYQEDAVGAFASFRSRGVVALPTGSGKTRVALAAMASHGTSALVLCPTRALLEPWRQALGSAYAGPIGVVGDGEHRVEDVSVMTFDSAYRVLDSYGDRFGMVVVDECHHFGSGARCEALEMCAAKARRGLTAKAPRAGSDAMDRLAQLIGPVVFELRMEPLLGTYLAELSIVRLPVQLDAEERAFYEPRYEAFSELRRAFFRSEPRASFSECLRALSQTSQGRAAITGWNESTRLASFPEAKRRLVRELFARHRAQTTLAFTATADDAYRIAIDNLVPAITSEIGRTEREDVLRSFREGKLRGVVSARVLNEGIDVPDAEVAILVGGALGAREHVQRIGRVLRPAPGKQAIAYELVTLDTVDDARAEVRGRALAA